MNYRLKIGDKVTLKYAGGQEAIITAIMMKGGGYREYKCSYTLENKPAESWVVPIEIEKVEGSPFGFNKRESTP